MHIVMGIILALIAFGFLGLHHVLAPKIQTRMNCIARHSFGLAMVTVSAYMFWIAGLFFHDQLHGPNYSVELWIIRLALMASLGVFLLAARVRNGNS